jgi:NAD(P)-dependent dehydrogenase (short-subunit alcohol dehydrogenase family)
MNLDGAVVVVTGASSGIGEAVSRRFARGAARVVLAARRVERLQTLERSIAGRGGEALAVRCDVTSRDDIDALVDTARERFGRIDVLVNNAGIPGGGAFRSLDAARIERIVDVNVLGAMRTTKAFLPMFLEQGSGHIVNVASLAGRFATPGSSVYGATKHAVVAFGESLAYELEPFGIRVTTVNPGFTRTEGFPQDDIPRPFVMSADRVARTIVDVVANDRGPEVSLPRWLGAMQVFRVLTPPLYRWGVRTITRRATARGDV